MEPAAPVGPPSAQSAGSGTITGPPDARRRQDRRSPQRDRAAVKTKKMLTETLGRAPKDPHYLLEKERNEFCLLDVPKKGQCEVALWHRGENAGPVAVDTQLCCCHGSGFAPADRLCRLRGSGFFLRGLRGGSGF